MSTTNVNTREPSVLDYASPVQFRFKCSKLPTVEFFCQTANIPGIGLGVADVDTPLKSIPFPGDKVTYQDLAISFLVDENLNNYKEIHDWIIGLGAPQNHTQFSDSERYRHRQISWSNYKLHQQQYSTRWWHIFRCHTNNFK